jgi:hypothetical protein
VIKLRTKKLIFAFLLLKVTSIFGSNIDEDEAYRKETPEKTDAPKKQGPAKTPTVKPGDPVECRAN